MTKSCSLLPMILLAAFSGCSSGAKDSGTPAAKSETAAPVQETTAPPGTPQVSSSSVNASADVFTCAYGGEKSEEFKVVVTDLIPNGDHLGPVGNYKVSGGGKYKGATGAVRLSDEEYEFLDGALGLAHAKIFPASQGFYALIVGNEGVQCDKQGADHGE